MDFFNYSSFSVGFWSGFEITSAVCFFAWLAVVVRDIFRNLGRG